jgi:hypothetical protein
MAEASQTILTDLKEAIEELAKNVGKNEEVLIAIVALVISVVALVASLLQVAQQYYASAAGYANCDSKVMGRWATMTKRVLRPTEFRFEVQFQAPVLFLCPPNNINGPITGQDITFVNGTPKSLEASCSTLPSALKDDEKKKSESEKIHTADNELATWVTLLAALHQLELDSLAWQQRQFESINLAPPREKVPVLAPPDPDRFHTLAVALQRKRRSWDTMPAGVTKPYATTTMCHLVEMMAILGIYWVEFDRSHSRYRAEGNGYQVTGENVSDLGLMFSFQVCGKSLFRANRVIPVDEVKELCFGVAPTIYRRTLDSRKLELSNDDLRGISLLQLGSTADIAETLLVIGCNTNTVNYFLKDGTKHSHLFPITFEILGMIGQTLHIENSCFRVLPNPTMHVWNRKAFSLRRLLVAYADCFNNVGDDIPRVSTRRNPAVVRAINEHLLNIQKHLSELPPKSSGNDFTHIHLLNDLHRALDDADEILTAKQTQKRGPLPPPAVRPTAKSGKMEGFITGLSSGPPGHSRTFTEMLNEKETESERERLRREMVQDVLRSHIQEVLKMINDKRGDDSKSGTPHSTFQVASTDPKLPKFEDIDSAAPEDKQARFMEVYFKVIRVTVVGTSAGATRRRGSVVPGAVPLPAVGIRRTGTESIAEEVGADDQQSIEGNHGSTETDATKSETPKPSARGLYEEDAYHDDIWCSLVFRMIVWLMLHDFNKKDVQCGKSALLGSRLPVFIV